MFLDDTIKCGGVWSTENQLLCPSYVTAHFLLELGPVTNMSKLLRLLYAL